MKVSYQREFRHNYLIIDPEELVWQGYESQMLLRNQIEGILRFQTRQVDEKMRFYYEITSRQPLSRILENRGIQAEEIRRLMLGIFGILERMDTYLLREESILLDAEHLYVDPDSFRIWLCVVPGLKRDFTEDFGKLLEYLLGNVDHQDKESVVLAYGLYQETRKENYGLADLLRMLQGEKEPKEDILHTRNGRRGISEPDREETGNENERGGSDQDEKKTYGSTDRQEKHQQKVEGKSGGKKGRKQWKLPFFQKSDDEKEPLPARVPWEMMFQEPLPGESQKESGGQQNRGEQSQIRSGQGTVLLADFSEEMAVADQRILRALNTEMTDIPIPYYPFIIGKQENLVDFKLKQDTVSRLHVRIDRDNEAYRIKDLNSTNGTFVRGRLLENNEEVEIHEGDEICIARFRYRFE